MTHARRASSRAHHQQPSRQPPRAPIGLLHLLDGLLTQASLASHSIGVAQRRQRQRLALTQRLLDPLPKELVPLHRIDQLFWRGLRWGTCGLLIAWWLHR